MRARWSRWARWPTSARSAGPISVTRYNLYTAAAVNGSVPPDFSAGETIQTVDRLAEQSLPLAMKTEWTELMFLQIRAGDTAHVRLRPGRRSVFS